MFVTDIYVLLHIFYNQRINSEEKLDNQSINQINQSINSYSTRPNKCKGLHFLPNWLQSLSIKTFFFYQNVTVLLLNKYILLVYMFHVICIYHKDEFKIKRNPILSHTNILYMFVIYTCIYAGVCFVQKN